ncbi:MAG: hypothetical protein U9R69_09830 [Thermodesulfobacteriota bacterium]|nr:hypothetical protein [Thermodesulfobacteriota bacterium]
MIVAVCQEADGISVASIKHAPAGQPTLQFVGQEACFSTEERVRAMEQLQQQNNLQGSPCVAVLPGHAYQLIQVDMADLSADECRDAARWQIRERIDYPSEEAVIDLFEVAPFGSERKPLTYVVAAQQKILRERVQLIEQSGLSLESIDIPEFSLRNICDLFSGDEHGLAVLLLLKQSGVLVVVRDGTLYLVRWLSRGMDDLIPCADGDFEALAEKLDSMVLEIQRSFDYCESTFQLPMVSRLLVAQTQREIPAVVSYLDDYLATRVESFSFADVLTVPDDSDQLSLNQNLLVIGGALRQEKN